MNIENPYIKDLQDATRRGDNAARAEYEQKSREFIEGVMQQAKTNKQAFAAKTEEMTSKVKTASTSPATKESRKAVKAIYDEAILMNREYNEKLIIENRELKRLCREHLWPNQNKQ